MRGNGKVKRIFNKPTLIRCHLMFGGLRNE